MNHMKAIGGTRPIGSITFEHGSELEPGWLKTVFKDVKSEIGREAALRAALTMFMDRMARFGAWEEGCFYYNRFSASELQEPMELAAQALKGK